MCNPFGMDDYLIIANGLYEEEVIRSLSPGRIIIALDGAANNLTDIQPDFIVGDFDSITKETREKYEPLLIKIEDQASTDLKKGIAFAKERGAKSIAICCALYGARSDHSLTNLSLLKSVYDPNCPIILHTATEEIRFLQNETYSFKGTIGAKCGFFGWPKAIVTTKGLVWDVEKWETEVGKKISSSNELKESKVKIEVEGDLLLISPK